MESLAAYLSGLLFAIGLGVSGMTQPGKVTAFLDFAGSWDPSLAFVMAGAVLVYGVGYRLALRRPKPVLRQGFDVPARRPLDKKLVLGSLLFGAGWGLAGYCPGPALVSLASLQWKPALFVLSMLAGMWLVRLVVKTPKA